jgi:two-component system chemotaxis sensor kinase CheA
MDRGIQDEINEPLLHLLKNAVTHGIEKPAERENLGKPRRGRITLSARRERSSIVMDLSDDGRGMDIDDIRNNALKAGFATAQDLSRLSPHEVVMLAARPGYSGSAQVTEISGRGVGLNASKVKVESLGGALNIETVPGHGTTLHIRLPLTLAVVQALLATVGTETYCLPLASVAATLKVFPERVARVGGWEVMSYGDKTLPLIRLRDRFRIPHGQSGPHRANQGTPSSGMDVVVVEAGSSRAGLVISGLLGTADVVVKPLPRLLAGATGVSGATILSDGRVALILDVGYLLSQGETPWGP